MQSIEMRCVVLLGLRSYRKGVQYEEELCSDVKADVHSSGESSVKQKVYTSDQKACRFYAFEPQTHVQKVTLPPRL